MQRITKGLRWTLFWPKIHPICTHKVCIYAHSIRLDYSCWFTWIPSWRVLGYSMGALSRTPASISKEWEFLLRTQLTLKSSVVLEAWKCINRSQVFIPESAGSLGKARCFSLDVNITLFFRKITKSFHKLRKNLLLWSDVKRRTILTQVLLLLGPFATFIQSF